MKAWYDNLDRRERIMVVSSGIFLFIFMFYVMVWEPLGASVAQLDKRITSDRITLDWMKTSAAEVKKLRATDKKTAGLPKGRSLLSVIDDSTKKNKLAGNVKRIEPRGNDGVQIRLEDAPFNAVVRWLTSLKLRYGISTKSASIDRLEKNGLVNARLTLESPS